MVMQYFISPVYASEVSAALPQITDSTLQTQAATVIEIPTFIWFDQVAKVPLLGSYLAAAGPNDIVPIVIYDLPDRDCAADASNGEFSIADNGQANYENYIDQIVAQIQRQCRPDLRLCAMLISRYTEYPNVRVVAVIEPDSLANLVTNLNVAKCANAETTYKVYCILVVVNSLSNPLASRLASPMP